MKEQLNELQILIDYDIINGKTAEYVASSKLVGNHIIGNGFEIYEMKPSNIFFLYF